MAKKTGKKAVAKTVAHVAPAPAHGTMQVWHVAQMPCPAFFVTVDTLIAARFVLNLLAIYDEFQFENNIKPDYSSAGGLRIWDDTLTPDDDGEQWTEWYDTEGRELGELTDEELDIVKWEGAK
jgi:hypothetical protein